MVHFFTRYVEGAEHGWLYFERPAHLGRKQYQQVAMENVTILSHEGCWFGAFYYTTNGAGQRRLCNTFVFFGDGKQVWARMRRQFPGIAKDYHVRPLKVIGDEDVIRLVECRFCKGKGKCTLPTYEYMEPGLDTCGACVGTCVEERV